MLASIFCRFFVVFLSLFSTLLITPGLYITYPEKGSIVNGIVEIRGSVPATNFASATISYAYDGAGVENWFQIAEFSESMQDVVLVKWDTTTITDGTYQLRLSVAETNGAINEVIVDQITVMNYTHLATTPLPDNESIRMSTPVSLTEAVNTNRPTTIPENPAAADSVQLTSSMVTGIVLALIVLLLLLIYSTISGYRRRR